MRALMCWRGGQWSERARIVGRTGRRREHVSRAMGTAVAADLDWSRGCVGTSVLRNDGCGWHRSLQWTQELGASGASPPRQGRSINFRSERARAPDTSRVIGALLLPIAARARAGHVCVCIRSRWPAAAAR